MEKLNSKKFNKIDVVALLTEKMQLGNGSLRLKQYRDELMKREERKLKKIEKAEMSAKKKKLQKNLDKIMNPEVVDEGVASKVQFFNAKSRKVMNHQDKPWESNNTKTRTKDTFEEFKRQVYLPPDFVRPVPEEAILQQRPATTARERSQCQNMR